MADTNNNSTNLTPTPDITPLAKNLSNCSDCHSKNLKPSGVSTSACSSCHELPHNSQLIAPTRFNDLPTRTVHSEHMAVENIGSCTSCHGPPACNRCHSGHSIKEIQAIGGTQLKNCIECHGGLSAPYGHVSERNVFVAGSHNWMKCNNCHLSSNQFNFRDFVYPFNESYMLCSTCHSIQTKGHYQDASTNISMCVNCHNPHSTSLKEQLHINIPISDIGSIIGTIRSFILEIFNIVTGNFVIFLIVLIFIGSIIAEYLKNRADRLRKTDFVKLKEKRGLK